MSHYNPLSYIRDHWNQIEKWIKIAYNNSISNGESIINLDDNISNLVSNISFNSITKEITFSYIDLEGNLTTNTISLYPAYTEVNTFADLPDATLFTGITYHVLNETGTWILNTRRQSGLYRSNGTTWILRNDISSLLTDSEFNIRDDSDNTKGVKFILDNLTTGILRDIIWPDKSGTVAFIDDLQIFVNNITADFQIPLSITFPNNALIRLQNRSGNDWEITVTGADTIEGGSSATIFDGETFDLTIQGTDFRI